MPESVSFEQLCAALAAAGVRFVLIGVSGANLYAAFPLFMTRDQDLFLPADAPNLLAAWQVVEQLSLDLYCGDEPLDMPRDEVLARAVVDRRAVTSVVGPDGLLVDLTLTMTGCDFESVYVTRRTFCSGGVDIPVARLRDIVASKSKAGREKDRLFLATHAEALRRMLADDAGA